MFGAKTYYPVFAPVSAPPPLTLSYGMPMFAGANTTNPAGIDAWKTYCVKVSQKAKGALQQGEPVEVEVASGARRYICTFNVRPYSINPNVLYPCLRLTQSAWNDLVDGRKLGITTQRGQYVQAEDYIGLTNFVKIPKRIARVVKIRRSASTPMVNEDSLPTDTAGDTASCDSLPTYEQRIDLWQSSSSSEKSPEPCQIMLSEIDFKFLQENKYLIIAISDSHNGLQLQYLCAFAGDDVNGHKIIKLPEIIYERNIPCIVVTETIWWQISMGTSFRIRQEQMCQISDQAPSVEINMVAFRQLLSEDVDLLKRRRKLQDGSYEPIAVKKALSYCDEIILFSPEETRPLESSAPMGTTSPFFSKEIRIQDTLSEKYAPFSPST